MSRHRPTSPRAPRATRFGITTAIAMLLLAGCTPVPRQDQATNAASTPTQSAATPNPAHSPSTEAGTPERTATSPGRTPDATQSPSTRTESASLDGAAIEPGGVGPIRIGMSRAEAQANGWVAMNELCQRWDASPELLARGLSFTFVDDRLYEIWVRGFEFATEDHVRVSDTLRKAREVYGSDLQTELRDGGGGRLPAWFVVEGEHELLFLEEDPGRDETIKAILARTRGTPVIEGC